jgi:hypothetical protein
MELTEKAENAAKTTSDYMQVAKHFQEIAKLQPSTTVKQTEKVNYNELLEPVSTTITREISTTIPTKCPETRENTSTPCENSANTQVDDDNQANNE